MLARRTWWLCLVGVLCLGGASVTWAQDEAAPAEGDVAPAAEAPPADAPADDAAATPPAEGVAAPAAPAEEPAPAGPFYERDPYDHIELKDGTSIDVLPLDLSGRRIPENPRGADVLTVRFPDKPAEAFELRWRDVAGITLWEQMVLAEAEKLVAAGEFDAAYDFYAYLDRDHAGFTGVKESIERYLYEEAKYWQRQSNYHRTMALLLELHDRNPDSPGLSRALGITTGKLIELQLADDEYPAARRLLAGLEKQYPNENSVRQWRDLFAQRAQTAIEEAKTHLAAGRIREAQTLARRAMTIWPELATAREFSADLNARFPYVAVGVTQPISPQGTAGNVLDDWAFRRSQRLLNRSLFELSGYGVEGGEYRSPLGEVDHVDLGLGLNFRLRRDLTWSPSGALLSGHDVARHLLTLADPASPIYRADWGELLASVDVNAVFDVDVRLKRTHVRPEAMLQEPLIPWDAVQAGEQPIPTDGPYRVESNSGDTVQYTLNENYFARGATQPHLLDERHFTDSATALKALRLGEISVLDRINPWEVGKVQAISGVAVVPYGVPTVHCLIPNRNRPLPANRQFRRALAYGINRDLILSRDLLGRREDPGTRLISGPFPLGYAYNDQVPIRPFDPNLARVLSRVALAELAKKESEEKATETVDAAPAAAEGDAKPPTAAEQEAAAASVKLVLAHPAHEIARTAAQEIARQLQAVMGLTVELVELDPNLPADQQPEYDLRYAELALWEPIVDARRLLGSDGLAGATSPHLDLALRQLAEASDWRTARDKLFEIHRLAAEDVTVVPLWQMTDYFAHDQDLEGVGNAPVSLYQDVECWQDLSLPPGNAATGAAAGEGQVQP